MMEKNCNVINRTCKDSSLSLISENQDWKKMNELVSAPNTDDAHGPSRSKTWSRIWRVAQIWALMDVFPIQLEGSNMTSCQHGHTKWRFQSGLDFTNQDWKNVSELVFQVTSDRCWFLSKIWLRIARVAKIYYCFGGGFQWSYLQPLGAAVIRHPWLQSFWCTKCRYNCSLMYMYSMLLLFG